MKRCYFTIADKKNVKYFELLKKSLEKTNPGEELILFTEEDCKQTEDPHIYYRATPYFAKALMDKGYDQVCKLDSDQIVLGDLSHLWELDYDLGVVNNSNPRQFKKHNVSVWDVHPMAYVNCGLVVLKSKEVVDHWGNLCYGAHFGNYQYREQDLLNILVWYGNYNVALLDSGNKWHGLIWRDYEPLVELRDGKLILPANDEWNKEDKEVVVWHNAGGNVENKLNYRISFKEDVSKYIDNLVK